MTVLGIRDLAGCFIHVPLDDFPFWGGFLTVPPVRPMFDWRDTAVQIGVSRCDTAMTVPDWCDTGVQTGVSRCDTAVTPAARASHRCDTGVQTGVSRCDTAVTPAARASHRCENHRDTPPKTRFTLP